MKFGAFVAAACLAIASQEPATAGPVTTDLSLWLEADNGLATDGSTWADQSGNGHNATAVQGQAPTYVPSAINGLPVAHFSGAQLMAIAGQVVSSQRFTIIVVGTDESTQQHGDFCDVVSNWTGSTGTRSVFLGTVWKRPGNKFLDRVRFTDEVGGSDQGQEGVGRVKNPTAPFILSAFSANNSVRVYVGSKRQYELGKHLKRRDFSGGWFLGDQGNCFCEYWLGDVAEVLVYNKALSPSEFQADIGYLKAKWQ
jgi:hypothetical protein